MSEYRNYDDEWLLRSDNYCKHVSAMTGEKLHSKADIAAELAYRDDLIEQLQQRVQELEIAIGHSLRDMEYAAFNLCESMNLDSENGGRTVETTCPEKSLLIAIRDLKEAMGAG